VHVQGGNGVAAQTDAAVAEKRVAPAQSRVERAISSLSALVCRLWMSQLPTPLDPPPFHVFTLRILGDVSRLTTLAIDQQSSHRSSRSAPPGFAPARCIRTHARQSMTTKADRQMSLLTSSVKVAS
jgi:hypothetical protein